MVRLGPHSQEPRLPGLRALPACSRFRHSRLLMSPDTMKGVPARSPQDWGSTRARVRAGDAQCCVHAREPEAEKAVVEV